MLLFCLTTKTYLSPQLLVYMPINLPVHYITLPVHFDYFIPTINLYLPVFSPVVLNIHKFTFFINQPVQFVYVFQLIYWSVY